MLLPSLSMLRRVTMPALALLSVLGAALGVIAFPPVAWLSWNASAAYSGPPQQTLLEDLAWQISDPISASFPNAGSVTAALYWRVLPRRRGE